MSTHDFRLDFVLTASQGRSIIKTLIRIVIVVSFLPTAAVAIEERKGERISERERKLRKHQFKALGYVS